MKKVEEVEAEIKGVENMLNRPQVLSGYGRNYWRSNLIMLRMLRDHFHPINPDSATFSGSVDALKWYLKEEEE